MTTYIIFANSDDGFLSSNAATYAAAQAGAALTLDNSSNSIQVGQYADSGPTYRQYEAFLHFDTSSVPTTEHGIAAMVKLTMIANSGILGDINSSPGNDIDIRSVTWASPLTTAQWKVIKSTVAAGAQFGAQYGNNFRAQSQVLCSSAGNCSQIVAGGQTFFVIASSRAIQGIAPVNSGVPLAGKEYATFDSSNIGTTADPTLVYTTVKRDTMRLVNKCQAQLSTGDIVAIVSDGADPTPSLTLGYYAKGSTTFTTISAIGDGTSGAVFTSLGGNNVMDLVVDASDNIYVIGCTANNRGYWYGQGFVKGAGLSWTAKTALASPSAGQYTVFQQVASTWVNVTGSNGYIYAVAFSEYNSWYNPSANLTYDMPYAVMNCAAMLAGSGALVKSAQTQAYYNSGPQYPFDGGVRLTDVVAFTTAAAKSCLIGIGYASKASATGAYYLAWNVLAFNQAGGASNARADNGYGVANPIGAGSVALAGDSQIKCVQIDASKFAIVFGQSSTYHSVCIVDGSGNGRVYSDINSGTMPDFSATSDWDAVYDPAGKVIWLYYIDATNNRRIARVPFNMNTGVWSSTTETQVTAALGSAGGTNSKLRATPSTVTGLNIVIESASVTSGGVWSTSAVLDNFDNPPNAPTLATIQPFDATGAHTFTWTFSDPDSGDSQSAYAVEIDNNSTGASAYRSGTVTSTSSLLNLSANALTNGVTWRWRVSTKDFDGSQGPFSQYLTFQTSTAGTLTITNPASDNPAGQDVSSLAVTWTLTGATQAKYQLKMIRLLDGATLFDTGLVTSTATSVTVPGIPTDMPVRFDLVITNSLAIATPVASRYYTTSYAGPDQITSINATSSAASVALNWTVPTPTGARPSAQSYDVFRSIDGGNNWTQIVSLPPGSAAYIDSVVPSQCTPMYVVRSNATTGYTWSVQVTASAAIAFNGIVINQQGLAAGTQWSQYQTMFFGGAANEESLAISATPLQFAGRANPVYEFGDGQTDSIDVKALLPFQGNPIASLADTNFLADSDIRVAMTTIAEARQMICFRDGRGRQIFGAIVNLTSSDDPVGTAFEFTVNAVDFSEGVVVTNVTT